MDPSKFSVEDGMHVFETSWEVVNKVGGIHTVIKTKAPTSVKDIGQDKYFMLGPLLSSNINQVKTEMEEIDVDFELQKSNLSRTSAAIYNSVKAMRDRNCRVVIGKWLIEGG